MAIKRTKQAQTFREKKLGIAKETVEDFGVPPVRWAAPRRYRWKMLLLRYFPFVMRVRCLFRKHNYVPFFSGDGMKTEKQKDGSIKISHFFSEVYCTRCGKRSAIDVQMEGMGMCITSTE